MLIHQNHAAGEENGSIMVEMFVCLCLASKKPSEREFFLPAGTDLGVKLLRCFKGENIVITFIISYLWQFFQIGKISRYSHVLCSFQFHN